MPMELVRATLMISKSQTMDQVIRVTTDTQCQGLTPKKRDLTIRQKRELMMKMMNSSTKAVRWTSMMLTSQLPKLITVLAARYF